MSVRKSRREVLQSGVGVALLTAIPSLAYPSSTHSQGGTNPVIKVPGEIDARSGGSLRVSIYPSVLDNVGEKYEIRVFELQISKDAQAKYVITEKHQGIDGIEDKEFFTVVEVKDVATPMIATIKLDYIAANLTSRVIVVGAYNSIRSGIATVLLKKV